MLRWIWIVFSLWAVTAVNAQTPVKAEKAFVKGRELVRQHKPAQALRQFERAIAAAPTFYEAHAERARLLLQENDPRAEQALHDMLAVDPRRDPTAWLALARLAREKGHYAAAAAHADQFMAYVSESHQQYAAAKNLRDQCLFIVEAMENPVPFEPEPLSAAINDPNLNQYGPVFSRKGDFVVFTRRIRGQEDFYYAWRMGGDFTEAEPLTALNTQLNEGMHTLSRDGRYMVFTWCHEPGGFGSCDLYETNLQADGRWTLPKNLGGHINTKHWDAQPALSADGNTLIWSSTRPGGPGESNLWWSHRQADGSWGVPGLLKGSVNTSGREQTPFLHADGMTLYFASTGHPGLGDFDLFVSRYDPDSGFVTPTNLGYPINTTGHEGALSLDLDGKTAYFSTDRFHREEKNSRLMIYWFTLPDHARGTPVTYVEGLVRDARNGLGLSATLSIQGREQDRTRQITADEEGTFFLTLASGEDYAVQVDHPGYVFHSSRFELSDSNAFRPYELVVTLHPVEQLAEKAETRFVLENVLFETGKSELLPASLFELMKVRDFLKAYTDLRIRLEGHTDDVGGDAMNLRLSQERAEAVRNWLVANGIADKRLEARGYGSSRPIADNSEESGRRLNRRTEMVILP